MGTGGASYLGHDDWRMPTTEEIVTLAESVQFFAPPTRLDPAFFTGSDHLWLADRDAGGRAAYVFGSDTGSLFGMAFSIGERNALKVVRTAAPAAPPRH